MTRLLKGLQPCDKVVKKITTLRQGCKKDYNLVQPFNKVVLQPYKVVTS